MKQTFNYAPWLLALSMLSALFMGCRLDERRSGLPATARAALETQAEHFNLERYDRIYNEAADEWRAATTLENSNATFKQVREKMGRIKTRAFQPGRITERARDLPGTSLEVASQTTFENGEAREAFTLVERDGRWQLARYHVSSERLK